MNIGEGSDNYDYSIIPYGDIALFCVSGNRVGYNFGAFAVKHFKRDDCTDIQMENEMTDQTQSYSEDEMRKAYEQKYGREWAVSSSPLDSRYSVQTAWILSWRAALSSQAEQIRKLEAEVERLARHDAQNVADKIRKYSASGDTSHT